MPGPSHSPSDRSTRTAHVGQATIGLLLNNGTKAVSDLQDVTWHPLATIILCRQVSISRRSPPPACLLCRRLFPANACPHPDVSRAPASLDAGAEAV